MGQIQTTDARGLFTKGLIDVFREHISPMSFLRSFFPVKENFTKEISIEVQRGTEKIAVDVLRGTEGNRNTITRSTEKIFVPPYFREYFDATEIDLYDRVFGSTTIDAGIFSALMERVTEKLGLLQNKIERSYELKCAQTLLTGIVELHSGDNIDFKRKAESIVDLTAPFYWDVPGTDPFSDLERGGNFIRQVGKTRGGILNLIMGSKAHNAYRNNAIVQGISDNRRFTLSDLKKGQQNMEGGVPQGVASAGSYDFRIWTYPEFYDDVGDVSTPFIDEDKIIILPSSPRFKLSFAAVPQLMTKGATRKGAFVIGDYTDPRNDKHVFDIKSAGIPIPVAVDQIYTLKVAS